MLERFALIFTQPVRGLRRRIERWIMQRTPCLPGPVILSRRRVYILPTRFGCGYAVLVLVILLGAMNYSNSLAFCLAFLLGGLGLVAMHQTHGNLVNLELAQLHTAAVFAGDEAAFGIELANPTRRPRYAIDVDWFDGRFPRQTDLSAAERVPVLLGLASTRRGWLRAPRMSVSTEFPLGLFRAWSWIELDQRCLVYPRPVGSQRIPPSAGTGHGSGVPGRPGQDEFAGLRPYQRGDHPRSIHWKSLPKLSRPMIKQFEETQDRALWLDWSKTVSSSTEMRLSQLTRWVLAADAQHLDYGLRLPSLQIAPAHGRVHYQACLRALALFENPQ